MLTFKEYFDNVHLTNLISEASDLIFEIAERNYASAAKKINDLDADNFESFDVTDKDACDALAATLNIFYHEFDFKYTISDSSAIDAELEKTVYDYVNSFSENLFIDLVDLYRKAKDANSMNLCQAIMNFLLMKFRLLFHKAINAGLYDVQFKNNNSKLIKHFDHNDYFSDLWLAFMESIDNGKLDTDKIRNSYSGSLVPYVSNTLYGLMKNKTNIFRTATANIENTNIGSMNDVIGHDKEGNDKTVENSVPDTRMDPSENAEYNDTHGRQNALIANLKNTDILDPFEKYVFKIAFRNPALFVKESSRKSGIGSLNINNLSREIDTDLRAAENSKNNDEITQNVVDAINELNKDGKNTISFDNNISDGHNGGVIPYEQIRKILINGSESLKNALNMGL